MGREEAGDEKEEEMPFAKKEEDGEALPSLPPCPASPLPLSALLFLLLWTPLLRLGVCSEGQRGRGASEAAASIPSTRAATSAANRRCAARALLTSSSTDRSDDAVPLWLYAGNTEEEDISVLGCAK